MQRFATLALIFAMVLLAGCSSDDGTPAVPRIDGPSDLRAAALSSTTVRLNWTDNSFNENGFKIERAPAGANNWTTLDSVDVDIVTFTDASLSEGNVYQYRVSAYIGKTTSTPAGPVNIATPLLAPSGRPTAVRVSETSIRVSWVDASQVETNYLIERKSAGIPYELIATLPADTVSYLDTGLTPSTLYYYHVKAVRDTISSAWSNEASARTTVLTPGPPTDLIALGGTSRPNKARLTWADNAEGESGYVVELSMTGNSDWAAHDSLPENRVFAEITGLTAETTVFFRLYAWNQYGNSAYSNVASCQIAGPPAAPTNLIGSAPDYFAAILSWTDNAQSEDGFRVERRPNPGSGWSPIATVGIDVVNFNDSTAYPNRGYAYRVLAFNAAGPSAYSNEVTVTMPNGPPLPPRSLDATPQDVDRIIVFWQDRSDDEDGFFLERKTPGDQQFSLIGVIEPNITQYADSLLTPESWYAYRIRAHNPVGYSEYSNIDSTMTQSLTVFRDDFESYEVGAPPTGAWSILNQVGSSWAEVSATRPHNGAQSLQIHDPTEGDNFVMIKAGGFQGREATLTSWLFIPPNSTMGFIAGDRTDTITFQLQFNADNSVFVRNGAGLANPEVNYPVARWFKLDVEFSTAGGYYFIRFDDQPVGDTLFLVKANRPTTQLILIGFSDATMSDGFVDDIEMVRTWIPQGTPRRNTGWQTPPMFDAPASIEDAIRAVGPVR